MIRLEMPFEIPKKNRKAIITSAFAMSANKLKSPIASAIWIHCLNVNYFFRKYPIKTPTTQPNGRIPLIILNLLVFSFSVIPLDNKHNKITNC